MQTALNAANQFNYTTFWYKSLLKLVKIIDFFFNSLRLDVENEAQYWRTQSYNQAWITEALTALANASATIGIYTNKVQWTDITGRSFSGGSQYPLW